MKRILALAALICCIVPWAVAQNEDNRAEFGVFGDYFRVGPANTNFYGVGGRVGFNLQKHVQLEGETAYDFTQNFSTNVPCISQPCPPTPANVGLHVWHGLFGPKLQTSGPVRLFVEAKGGFVNFAGGGNLSLAGFANQVGTFGGPGTFGTFFPGGGVEGYLGKIGLRLDVGDEMWFSSGAHHNLKVTFGPSIRF